MKEVCTSAHRTSHEKNEMTIRVSLLRSRFSFHTACVHAMPRVKASADATQRRRMVVKDTMFL